MNYKKRLSPAYWMLASMLLAAPFFASCGGNNEQQSEDYVDLGLPSGTLWATANVGASAPEEYGNYYAWAETKTYSEVDESNTMNYNYAGSYIKTAYNWFTYKYCQGSETTMTKYCMSSDFGTVDSLNVLQPVDDAATANLGEEWRMPTIVEWKELLSACNWVWTQRNSVNGYQVTGPNGKSIFLPASGARFSKGRLNDVGVYGYYWSSSLGKSNSYNAYCVRFYAELVESSAIHRGYGRSIRPVRTVKK